MTRPRMTVVSAPDGARERVEDGWLDDVVAQPDGAVLVHVSAGAEDLPRIAAASWALAETGAFAQIVLDLAGEPGEPGGAAAELAALDAPVELRRVSAGVGRLPALESALAAARATAVIVHADDDPGLAAAVAAARLGAAVVRVGRAAPGDGTARVISRLADLQLVFGHDDAAALGARLGGERIHVVGNPLIDAVRRFARPALARAAWRAHGVSPGGYRLVVLTAREPEPEIAAALAALGEPVLVEAPAAWRELLAGVRHVEPAGFLARLSLERGAAAIVADSARVHEEAAAIGVPSHPLAALRDPAALGAVDRLTPCAIPLSDGRAGARLARALVANFARVRLA